MYILTGIAFYWNVNPTMFGVFASLSWKVYPYRLQQSLAHRK